MGRLPQDPCGDLESNLPVIQGHPDRTKASQLDSQRFALCTSGAAGQVCSGKGGLAV